MARAPALSQEKLVALGAETLARLVLDGVERDTAFKRIVMAALAATKGPQAVAALVEKRLAGLEKARGIVDWDKAKAFAADLDATVTTIADQIGPADAVLASTLLLRFLKTADGVFDRADDSQGRIQAVYDRALDAMGPLAERLPESDKTALPARIMTATAEAEAGFLPRLIQIVGPHLDDALLLAWDRSLAAVPTPASAARKNGMIDYRALARASRLLAARQMIAFVRTDLDGFAALEASKPAHAQNTLGVARLLLEARRPAEALAWVRKDSKPGISYSSRADLADGMIIRSYGRLQRSRLEADILAALGQKAEAQALRWATFAETLDADILRAYMGGLGEFEEFDALDRIFAHVEAASNIHGALTFLLEWPRLDKAAALVVTHRARWDGRSYDLLAPAAEMLEPDHPVAAALLYRRLLDAILAAGQSKAYGHAARYLARLDALAPDLDRAGLADVPPHATYRAGIEKTHARKVAFWAQVE